MIKKRTPLGRPLPPVKDVAVPTEQQLDELSALWDRRVPELAGLMEAKPLGSEQSLASRFWWDEVKRRYIRASNGRVVTTAELRAAMEKFQDGVRK